MLVLLITVSVSILIYLAESKVLTEEIQQRQSATVKGLAQITREAFLVNDDLLIFNYLNLLKKTNKAIGYASVLNNEKMILAHTDATKLRTADDSAAAEAAVRSGDLFHQEFVMAGAAIFEISMPVMMGAERAGTARIGFSKKVLNEMISDTLASAANRIFTIGAGALLIGLLAGFIFAHTMTKPISDLAAGAKLIGGGNLDTVISIKRKDELGSLAQEFNTMARQL